MIWAARDFVVDREETEARERLMDALNNSDTSESGRRAREKEVAMASANFGAVGGRRMAIVDRRAELEVKLGRERCRQAVVVTNRLITELAKTPQVRLGGDRRLVAIVDAIAGKVYARAQGGSGGARV